MDNKTQRILDEAERAVETYQKGNRTPQLLSEMAKLREELDALMPHEIPPFMKKSKRQRLTSGEEQVSGG